MKTPRRMWAELAAIDKSVVLVALLLVAGIAALAMALTGEVSAPLELRSSIGP